jgi:hypothetical protein
LDVYDCRAQIVFPGQTLEGAFKQLARLGKDEANASRNHFENLARLVTECIKKLIEEWRRAGLEAKLGPLELFIEELRVGRTEAASKLYDLLKVISASGRDIAMFFSYYELYSAYGAISLNGLWALEGKTDFVRHVRGDLWNKLKRYTGHGWDALLQFNILDDWSKILLPFETQGVLYCGMATLAVLSFYMVYRCFLGGRTESLASFLTAIDDAIASAEVPALAAAKDLVVNKLNDLDVKKNSVENLNTINEIYCIASMAYHHNRWMKEVKKICDDRSRGQTDLRFFLNTSQATTPDEVLKILSLPKNQHEKIVQSVDTLAKEKMVVILKHHKADQAQHLQKASDALKKCVSKNTAQSGLEEVEYWCKMAIHTYARAMLNALLNEDMTVAEAENFRNFKSLRAELLRKLPSPGTPPHTGSQGVSAVQAAGAD